MIWFILLLGFILRLININQSLWLDEASQALTANKSLYEIIFQNNADFQPPFSYILSHFWIQLGDSEIWLRLLPVSFGVGTVWVLYLLARKLFNQPVAILAALLLTINPYHIYYSQEFRMYSMVTFFTLFSVYFFIKLTHEKVTKKNLIPFIIFSTLTLYTHYLGIMILISQLVYLLIFERHQLKKIIGAYLGIGLLFLLWSPFFYQQLINGTQAEIYLPGWTQMLSLSIYKAIPLLVTKFIVGRIDIEYSVLTILMLVTISIVVGIPLIPIIKKLREKNVLLILILFIVPIVLTFLLSFKLPMFQPFRLLFTLPYLIIILSVGILEYRKYQKFIIIFVCLLFVSWITWSNTQQQYFRENWREAISSADTFIRSKNEGKVLFAWPENFAPYTFYSNHNFGLGVVTKMPANREDIDNILTREHLGNRIVYFSYLSQLSDPNNTIQEWLETHDYKLIEVKDFRGVGFVNFYLLKSQTIGLLTP